MILTSLTSSKYILLTNKVSKIKVSLEFKKYVASLPWCLYFQQWLQIFLASLPLPFWAPSHYSFFLNYYRGHNIFSRIFWIRTFEFFHQYFSDKNENKFLICQKLRFFHSFEDLIKSKKKIVLHDIWHKKFVDSYSKKFVKTCCELDQCSLILASSLSLASVMVSSKCAILERTTPRKSLLIWLKLVKSFRIQARSVSQWSSLAWGMDVFRHGCNTQFWPFQLRGTP